MQLNLLGKTGLRVSQLGFGAATLGDEYGPADAREAERAVHYAIDRGINFFDVAPYYGRTLAETRLGQALNGRRDQVVLATKCARFDFAGFDFSAGGVTRMAHESLRRLGTEYLDILHVHDIEYGEKRQIIEETIPALRKLQTAGLIRWIGITGLALKMLREIAIESEVDCVLSYCRYTLLNRDLNRVLTPAVAERNIGLISASPLHMRLLTETGPPTWHPAPDEVKAAARQVVELCRSRGSNVAEVALQFAAGNPHVASTLVGISNAGEVESNLRAIESHPDPDLLKKIDEITRPVHSKTWITGRPENH